MVMSSSVVPRTTRPVFSQAFYFPIRLLDMKELTDPAYIEHCLPMDLLTNGAISLECWDASEAASEFLGGCEFNFAQIHDDGVKEMRALAEGAGADVDAGMQVKFFAAVEGEPGSQEANDNLEERRAEEANYVSQVYSKKMFTFVYKGEGTPLQGGTILTPTLEDPTVYFEAYVIPPLPEQVQLLAPLPQTGAQQKWRQFTRRWNRDLKKWQEIYQNWFPDAISNRQHTQILDDDGTSADASPASAAQLRVAHIGAGPASRLRRPPALDL
eukprot:GHVU01057717.1.p1 GENE.GHVU01057717.1~~GHVU01057717.1.p1  ORF type:complete len:270 (+),score=50.39 GHVU01057717.1:255-1064(+)